MEMPAILGWCSGGLRLMENTNRLEQFEITRRPDGTFWEIGRGTIGILYKALDTQLESDVVVKVINPQYLRDVSSGRSFLTGARAISNFRHPNVATLIHAGNSEGRIFCAMEYVQGETVEQRVKREGPLHPIAALRITGQITRSLIAAERRNLIHGDIKPSNVMLCMAMLAKVTDYGLARCLRPASGRSILTVPDWIGAFPDEASPNRMEENAPDIRSDIYSLGATLCFMVTGRPSQSSTTGMAAQRLGQPGSDLANLPKPLTALLEKMLAKLPEDRFQTPLELKSELDQLVSELQDSGSMPMPAQTASETIEATNPGASHFSAGQVIRNEYVISGAKIVTPAGEPIQGFNPLPGLKEKTNALLSVGASEPNQFASASDFVHQLERAESAVEASIPVSMPGTAPAATAAVEEQIEGGDEKEQSPRSRSPLRILSSLAALLVLGCIAAIFVTQFVLARPASQKSDPDGDSKAGITNAITSVMNNIGSGFIGIAQGVQTGFTSVTNAFHIGQAATPASLPAKAIPTASPDVAKTVSTSAVSANLANAIPNNSAAAALAPIDTTKSGIALGTPADGKKIAPDETKASSQPSTPPKVGRLVLRSEPAGSQVEIVNGSRESIKAVTPVTWENLPIGKYVVKIKRDGWPDYQEEVNLQPDATATIDHKFEKVKVMLQSDPSGASIFMGETELGKTPLTVLLPPGPVDLVSRSGTLAPVTQRVVPDPSGSTAVEFKHDYGILSVNSDRSDAEVIIGGVDIGEAPAEEIVPPGPEQVIVQVPGMPDQVQKTDVQSGQRAVFEFKSTPLTIAAVRPTPVNQPLPSDNANQPDKSHRELHLRAARHSVTHRSKNSPDHDPDSDPSCAVDPPSGHNRK
jgi:serine/threonine protein kinase